MVMVAPAPPRKIHLALIVTDSKCLRNVHTVQAVSSEGRGSELEKALEGYLQMCFLMREGTHRDAASEEMYRKLALERARHPCFASGPFKRFQGTR